ncbi:hypothetical protein G6F65_000201 [Rhizopus arrhizus]|nr:hypothetical protein G6F65_000201 [Rhizopus arrhizus]
MVSKLNLSLPNVVKTSVFYQYKLSFAESGTEVALRQTANLASDEVGRLQIIDLSSTTALDILKSEIPIDQFNAIIEAANMDPVPMFVYASELSNALDKAPLSTCVLRETLYDVGYRKDFDLVAHDDAHFMKITIRYFLDLMSSPNSPLNKIMLERTAASYLIIYLDGSKEIFCSTDRSKFDGVLFKVGKKSICLGLIEFSGGINDKTSSRKNSKDIEKLYSSMIKVMKDAKTNRMFCMRCYGHYIYFEKLLIFDDTMYRKIDATMEIPNTPRKLKAFIKEIPSILAWKEAVGEEESENVVLALSLVHIRGPAKFAVARFFAHRPWITKTQLDEVLATDPYFAHSKDLDAEDIFVTEDNASVGSAKSSMEEDDPPYYEFSMSGVPLRMSLFNATGLPKQSIYPLINIAQNSSLLFITETWLLSPNKYSLPSWKQFYTYDVPVNSYNLHRGQPGLALLVNPDFKLPIHHINHVNPLLAKFTLSIIINSKLLIHCLYLPPSLESAQVSEILSLLPLDYPTTNKTIICGDFNSRIGELVVLGLWTTNKLYLSRHEYYRLLS